MTFSSPLINLVAVIEKKNEDIQPPNDRRYPAWVAAVLGQIWTENVLLQLPVRIKAITHLVSEAGKRFPHVALARFCTDLDFFLQPMLFFVFWPTHYTPPTCISSTPHPTDCWWLCKYLMCIWGSQTQGQEVRLLRCCTVDQLGIQLSSTPAVLSSNSNMWEHAAYVWVAIFIIHTGSQLE